MRRVQTEWPPHGVSPESHSVPRPQTGNLRLPQQGWRVHVAPLDDAAGATHGRTQSQRRGRSQQPTFPLTPTMLRSSIAKTLVNASPRASRLAARPVLARAYHEKVISHYEQPRNVRLAPPGLCPQLSDNLCARPSYSPGRLAPQERRGCRYGPGRCSCVRVLVVRRCLCRHRADPCVSLLGAAMS